MAARGLLAAFPDIPVQHCWSHEIRNVLNKVRKPDQAAIKADLLAPYRSAPSKKCRTGDEKIRLSFHQPNTAFAKRRQSSDEQGSLPDHGPGAMALFADGDLLIYLTVPGDRPPLPFENYTLAAIDLNSDQTHVIASVPPGSFQEGLDTVTVIDEEDFVIRTYQTRRTVFTDRGALVFHDLIVDHGGVSALGRPISSPGTCFASFFVEYAADPRQLFDK
jgi:hypothetical protein